MKKLAFVLTFVLLMLSAGQASAGFNHLTQNEFITAESLDPGMSQTGIAFTLGERYKSYYPVFRYGLGALFEVGLKVGATDVRFDAKDKIGPGDKLGALIGLDLKYQLIKETEGVPIDMAIDLGFDNTIINSKNISEVSFSTLFSKGFPLTDRGYKLTPYAGFEMGSMYGSGVPKKETSLYALAGLEWKLSQKFMFIFEFKGGHSNQGGLGLRFEY